MINKIEMNGVHLDIDDKTYKYVMKKLGKLDKYLPKKSKESAHLEVMLKDTGKAINHAICEVVLFLPKEKIIIKESTINIFAAIDIVEEKLKKSIMKYKELNQASSIRHKIKNKLNK